MKQKFQSGSHTQKKRHDVETLCALAMRSSTIQKRASSSSSFSFSSLFWVVVSLCDSHEKEKKNKECVVEMRTKEREGPLTFWSPSRIFCAIIIVDSQYKKWTTSSSFPLSSNFLSGSNTTPAALLLLLLLSSSSWASSSSRVGVFFCSSISLARIHRHP